MSADTATSLVHYMILFTLSVDIPAKHHDIRKLNDFLIFFFQLKRRKTFCFGCNVTMSVVLTQNCTAKDTRGKGYVKTERSSKALKIPVKA